MHSSRMRTVLSSGRISGVSASGAVCSREGGCLLPGGCLVGGVSKGGGCLLPGAVSAPGGLLQGRGCLLPGVSAIPPYIEAETLSPCGQTDACKKPLR